MVDGEIAQHSGIVVLTAAIDGSGEVTATALSATLFGAQDLRMVEEPLKPLPPGLVRVRFGAGGICGSDMHYFRHGRTGDFVVESPLVLGHEIAGQIVEIAGDAPRLDGRRSSCGQSFAVVRPLPALSRGPPEFVREHLLHGICIEKASYARWVRDLFRRYSGAVHQGLRQHTDSCCGTRRASCGLPSRRETSRRGGRKARHHLWCRADWPSDTTGSPAGWNVGDRCCRSNERSPGFCEASWRQSRHRYLGWRGRPQGPCSRTARLMLLSRFREQLPGWHQRS